jgi:glutathione S-transferase
MPSIKLFELGPTRSARVRWMLLEAELPYDSVGNSVEVFRSAELRSIHPLGKLPAAIIDGKPLFESAAIVTAIADRRTGDLVSKSALPMGLFRAYRDGALPS